jgi:hypothetical protein
MNKRAFVIWSLAVGCAGMVSLVSAADAPMSSGTVQISSSAVAVGIGVTWGDGTLSYHGQKYAFSVNGLSVVDLGISTVTATGEVSNLNNIEDFSGNYAAGEAGIAVAGGQSDVIMKNDHGVVLKLHGTQQGVRLTLAAQGVSLKLKN